MLTAKMLFVSYKQDIFQDDSLS